MSQKQKVLTVKPGHEDCSHDWIEYSTWNNEAVYREIVCNHDHQEDITAGDGPVVGHHCFCCGRVWVDQNYVTEGQQ